MRLTTMLLLVGTAAWGTPLLAEGVEPTGAWTAYSKGVALGGALYRPGRSAADVRMRATQVLAALEQERLKGPG